MKRLEDLLSGFRNATPEQMGQYGGRIIATVADLMAEDRPFIMPVAVSEEIIQFFGKSHLTPEDMSKYNGEIQMGIQKISVGSSGTAYAAFTNYSEADKAQGITTVTTEIDHYLEAVLFNNDISGLVINPFGNSCFLPKELIAQVFYCDYLNSRQPHPRQEEDVQINPPSAIEDALLFATQCHRGTFRKGSDTPYIIHPMEVASILVSVHADNNLIIAGLLHDTVEDTDANIEEIREKFGDDVARLVMAHTENKEKVWYARKLKTVSDLPDEDIRCQLLTLADKLSNLRSMYNDYKMVGESLWERFSADKSKQSWYYNGIVDGLSHLEQIPFTKDAYNQLDRMYKELFVTFLYDEQSQTMYRLSAHGEGYELHKSSPQWQAITALVPQTAVVISRTNAQKIESSWE